MRVGIDFGLVYNVNKFTFAASLTSFSIPRSSENFEIPIMILRS